MNGPFTEDYRFTGPTTAISCEVTFDKEAGVYRAHGCPLIADKEAGTGFFGESDTADAAALNCFRAWMTADKGYFVPRDDDA